MKKTGIEFIAEERQRQIESEGYTLEHDTQHTDESIIFAAICYAKPESHREYLYEYTAPIGWRWDVKYWKPTPNDRVKELVKAGALIAAEIDRLQAIE
jgi:hypothetical protein